MKFWPPELQGVFQSQFPTGNSENADFREQSKWNFLLGSWKYDFRGVPVQVKPTVTKPRYEKCVVFAVELGSLSWVLVRLAIDRNTIWLYFIQKPLRNASSPGLWAALDCFNETLMRQKCWKHCSFWGRGSLGLEIWLQGCCNLNFLLGIQQSLISGVIATKQCT